MRKYLPCLLLLVAMAVGSSTAAADPTMGPPICSSAGMPLSGTVGNLTITGNSYVPAGSTLTVRGNLTLSPGSCFDAFTVATVHVSGSVNVGRGAILGLGCSPGAIGPEPPCGTTTTDDTVGNGISAREALTMYLTAVTVNGSVTSIGGGPARRCTRTSTSRSRKTRSRATWTSRVGTGPGSECCGTRSMAASPSTTTWA